MSQQYSPLLHMIMRYLDIIRSLKSNYVKRTYFVIKQ